MTSTGAAGRHPFAFGWTAAFEERYSKITMTSADVRARFVPILQDDLVGPLPSDTAHERETLSAAPSHWYLTGFLAPTGQNPEDKEDEEAGDDIGSAVDDPSDGDAEAPAARRPVFPSSIGLTVLVRPESTSLGVTVSFGTYTPTVPAPAPGDSSSAGAKQSDPPPADELPQRMHWVRAPYQRREVIPLAEKARHDLRLEGSDGVRLRVVLRPVPPSEHSLVPPGTRYATLFLVNDRKAFPRPEQDRGYIFQVRFAVSCAEGFEPRPNPRGVRMDDDIDEKVGELHYRDAFEYAVGHGVSAQAQVQGTGQDVFCEEVATTWLPTAEVKKVLPSRVDGVTLEMGELGKSMDGAGMSGRSARSSRSMRPG